MVEKNRQAGAFEITPEMREAAYDRAAELIDYANSTYLVDEVLEAMITVANRACPTESPQDDK